MKLSFCTKKKKEKGKENTQNIMVKDYSTPIYYLDDYIYMYRFTNGSGSLARLFADPVL